MTLALVTNGVGQAVRISTGVNYRNEGFQHSTFYRNGRRNKESYKTLLSLSQLDYDDLSIHAGVSFYLGFGVKIILINKTTVDLLSISRSCQSWTESFPRTYFQQS